MKVHMSLGQLVEFGIWDEATEMLGISPFCLEDGASIGEMVSFTPAQAEKLGFSLAS